MSLEWYIRRLLAGCESVAALIGDLDIATWCWRPVPGAWSILEIVNHMADEEVEDFRIRLRLTLTDPVVSWPGIDPPSWVEQRGYRDRDPRESLDRFRAARAESLAWLSSLEDPDWVRTYEHQKLGSITAADLLTSWHAHDLLHLRQIARRLFEYAAAESGGGSPDYAGPW